MESRTHARPFLSNRNDEVIDWKEAQEILRSHQDSHDNCSSIPAMKPKGGEVFVYCAVKDGSKTSKWITC